MQVKMILRKPFLYQKYKNAKFEYFKHLDICKFDPPLGLKMKRKNCKSLSLEREDKDSLNKDIAEKVLPVQKLYYTFQVFYSRFTYNKFIEIYLI